MRRRREAKTALDGGDPVAVVGHQEAQGVRDGQHPLAHGGLRQRLVDQTGGGLGHAAAAAGRAEAAPLAGEGDDAVAPAFIAVDAQEPVRGDAAVQKSAEVAHDEKRDRAAAQLPAGEEGRKVLRDRMVQRAFPCAARTVRAHVHAASIALGILPINSTMRSRELPTRGHRERSSSDAHPALLFS